MRYDKYMTEQIDIHFRDHIIPPAETYEDTMRLFFGWSSAARGPDGELLPNHTFVADTDGTLAHTDAMRRCAAALYVHFGGTKELRVIEVSDEEVESQFSAWHDAGKFGVWGFEEPVIDLTQRYLRGAGDDYGRFWGVVALHALDRGLPSTELYSE